MFLCQMILTRRIPAYHLMMMIHSISHTISITTKTEWWLTRWGNAPTTRWTSRFTTISIITTRSSTTVSRSPCHTCCTRHDYSTKHWWYTYDTQYQKTTWWSTNTTCDKCSSSTQFHASNHLGGDTQPSVTPNATTQPAVVAPNVSNAKKPPKQPKDVAVPDDFDDDEPDPDVGPSGHHGPPVLPLDGDEPFNPTPMPEDDPQPDTQDRQEQEEEEEPEEDTDETIPYGSTDTDETLDYNDLVIDDSQWASLHRNRRFVVRLHHSLCPDWLTVHP